ncbi:MAG TPA: efflux RND transporter periplasmic adaptor subunit [Gemmataceae bacterium]|jgi:multidrug resistance efflux pump|nr:efflux RND transporter periplasmic adaptor subunit [Gemmataceae bacterium]
MMLRNVLIAGVAAVTVTAVGAAGAWRWLNPSPPKPPIHAVHVSNAFDDEEPPEGDEVAIVKTVHPKRDKAFTVTWHQYATVQPYAQVDLRARASGVIKYLPKDKGSRVTQGELLVEIDVPDLRQEVAQKDAVVEQRKNELRVAKAQLKTAQASTEQAQAAIAQAESQVTAAQATREFREKRFHRFQEMLARNGTTPQIVDEEKRDFEAAHAAWQAAQAAVKKAVADLHEKEASLEAAGADINLKESLVQVAKRDRDRTQALADYARLTAPFDGVIARRDVDLGAFVQNATASATKPLLTVERTDIVTVIARLPDNIAPLVTRDTRVLLTLDQMPGVQLEGRVTRFAPSVQNEDRTMQVEVDLFNRGKTGFARFLSQYFACQLAASGGVLPLDTLLLAAAGRDELVPRLRSVSDPLPIPPLLRNGVPEPPRLLPGMSGLMTVMLQRFANIYLLPSSVVFSRGGKQYILLVRDGKVHLTPVRVQVNDGQLAKLTVVARQANARTGETELLRELTGDEEVVASRQSEFTDGQAVHAVAEDW